MNLLPKFGAFFTLSFTILITLAQAVTYQEENGLLVVDVESEPVVSPWTLETSFGGYLGTGYFAGGEDHFENPGVGVLQYTFTVQNSGRYQVNWRSRIGSGSSTTDFNDSFARLTDSSGNPISPVSNGNTAHGSWYKLYMNVLGWDWETSNKDHDPKSLSWNLTAGQTYNFEISTRSEDHLIDRFVLWEHTLHTFANETTGKKISGTNSALDALSLSPVVEDSDPYTSWADDNGLTEGVNDGETDDPDFDRIENVLEYILGGDPLAADLSILPTGEIDGTDYKLTFTRSDDSEGTAEASVQFGSDLTSFPTTTEIVPATSGTVGSVTFTITENGASDDDVEATIPLGGATEFFGRVSGALLP